MEEALQTLTIAAVSGTAVLLVIYKALIAWIDWRIRKTDASERKQEIADYVDGYKAGKEGPKNGVPIGVGVNCAFMKGVRDAQDVRKNA